MRRLDGSYGVQTLNGWGMGPTPNHPSQTLVLQPYLKHKKVGDWESVAPTRVGP